MRDGAGHAYGHDHRMRLCCVPGGRDPILASRRASSAPARWCPRQSSISCITDFPAGDRPRAKSPYGPRRRNSQAARCTASTSVTSCKSTSYAAVPDRDRGSLFCPGRPVSPHARRFLRMTAGSGPWLFLARGACHSYRKAGPEHSNGAVSNNPVFLYGGDRGFESLFLQRRVNNGPVHT